MKKVTLFLIFTHFIVSICTGQVATKESLLNDVYHTLLKGSLKHFRHYYLYGNARVVSERIFNFDLTQSKRYIEQFLPDSVFNQMINNQKDTITELWNFDSLSRARCVHNKKPKGYFTHNKWRFKLTKWEKKECFSISKPLFSINNDWVIISIKGYAKLEPGYGCSHGGTYLFHKLKGKWVLVEKFGQFMS